MADSITVLETLGPCLTKVYKSDGTVDSYGEAANFKVREKKVVNLDQLADLLKDLHRKEKRCIIRGKFVGKEKAEKSKYEGAYPRTNGNFQDQPLHALMIDIDGFRPDMFDPVHETAWAIQDFVALHLPACFKGANFYWQLSSSAGMPGKEGILKCHLWFWLKTPYTTAQLYEWAKVIGPMIDKAIYRRVQIHYTSDPIFEEGREDPVPVRSGYWTEGFPEVDLRIGEETLGKARDQGAGEGGNDMKLVDPSEKEGLIGAFHRAFTPEQVLLELLDGEFERVTDRRYTWLNGGGTPEGVWVHDDGLHVGSSHNTWPISGIANLWDLVRVFKFGDLDTAEDDFERLDLETRPISSLPSHLAMVDWASNLPEIREFVREEKSALLRMFQDRILKAGDCYEVEEVVAKEIGLAALGVSDRAILANNIQSRLRELDPAAKISIGDVRNLIAPPRQRSVSEDAPDWAEDWVWINESDCFAHKQTKEMVSITSFNAMFDRMMFPYTDDNGSTPKASDMCLTTWNMPYYARTEYNPSSSDFAYKRDGMHLFNTYRPDLLPKEKKEFSPNDLKAIEIVKSHIRLLIPNDHDRSFFTEYLAFCVQNPGTKIRWSPLLKGVEGDGKSSFLTLLGLVMGSLNVRSMSSSTLESSSFSGWGTGSCVICIEEVKLHGVNRHDVFNKLKPFITNSEIEIHPKGRDPYNAPNTTNYILFSNFDDALPLTDNDRRIMFLRSPFTTKEQLIKAIKDKFGLSYHAYFDQLIDFAIKGQYRGLRKWLLEYPISEEFHPNGRAPESESRELIIEISKSDMECDAEDLIASGGKGIYPQLVVTRCFVQEMLNRYNHQLRNRQVSGLLSSLGFTNFGKTIRWDGEVVRVHYRGDKPTNPVALLDQLEAARDSSLVENDFAD